MMAFFIIMTLIYGTTLNSITEYPLAQKVVDKQVQIVDPAGSQIGNCVVCAPTLSTPKLIGTLLMARYLP